jgi:hypothetical protein
VELHEEAMERTEIHVKEMKFDSRKQRFLKKAPRRGGAKVFSVTFFQKK